VAGEEGERAMIAHIFIVVGDVFLGVLGLVLIHSAKWNRWNGVVGLIAVLTAVLVIPYFLAGR